MEVCGIYLPREIIRYILMYMELPISPLLSRTINDIEDEMKEKRINYIKENYGEFIHTVIFTNHWKIARYMLDNIDHFDTFDTTESLIRCIHLGNIDIAEMIIDRCPITLTRILSSHSPPHKKTLLWLLSRDHIHPAIRTQMNRLSPIDGDIPDSLSKCIYGGEVSSEMAAIMYKLQGYHDECQEICNIYDVDIDLISIDERPQRTYCIIL